jgi:hypothetical protein
MILMMTVQRISGINGWQSVGWATKTRFLDESFGNTYRQNFRRETTLQKE